MPYHIDEQNSDIEFEVNGDTVALKIVKGTGSGGSGTGEEKIYLIKVGEQTIPTDKNTYSALRILAEISMAINSLRKELIEVGNKKYFRKDIADATKFLASFLAGAEFGNYEPGYNGARIDALGNAETESVIFRNRIESIDFTPGPLGAGVIVRIDKATGKSYIEVDELFVRIRAIFTELQVKKLTYAGGNWIFSAAGGKCVRVEELPDVYRCYLRVDDGETAVENEFVAGDQVRCQEFNIKAGVHQGVTNQYYWRLCTAVGIDYIDLSKSDCDAGSGVPKIGDDLVQLGHRSDQARQNAIVISAYGEGAPAITQYAGIKSYSLSGTEKTRISPTKNVFTGEFHFSSGANVETAVNNASNAANAASGKADAAQSTANTAVSKADAAQGTANAANTAAQQAKEYITTEIKALGDKIALKVDSTSFNSLSQKVTQQGSELQLAKDAIASKVSITTFNEEMEKKNILAACNDSNMISDDPSFRRGMNGITVYNNAYTEAVTINRLSGCPVNSSGYYLDLRTAATGDVTPGYGGFAFRYLTSARKRLVAVFSAWLDKGRHFTFATNPTGNNSRHFWLTDNKGKGTWATYAMYVECGTDGDFATTFYFAIGGGGRPVTTKISYAALHQLDVNQDFKVRISSAETSITQLSNSIKLKADQATVDGINNRLSSAEIALNPDKIWLKVSEKVNKVASDESNKTKEEIKAGIGVTPNGITILGKTISLSGVVTFSSLDTNAQNKINTAQNTANAANTAAGQAQADANKALTQKIGRDRLDTTIIDGGKILTDLINVDSIFAREITANEFHLTAGRIGAFRVNSKGLLNEDLQAYINISQNINNFVRINAPGDGVLLSVRAQDIDMDGVSIYTQRLGYTALSITAQGYATAIKSRGSHYFLQRDGERWNAPGVLWAAKIDYRNGQTAFRWGDGLNIVPTLIKNRDRGSFTVVHNLGRLDYFPFVTTEMGDNRTAACVYNVTENEFSVQVVNMTNSYVDAHFFVCIIGRNKW